MMTPVSEPALAVATADPFLAAEVPEPSPAAEVPGPSPTAETAETSSAAGAVTVEEVMELATCQYIDLPGVGVIDLEATQLPEKVLDVAMEMMFVEPSIMEMIVSVSKMLHEYERTGGFAPSAASEAAKVVPEGPAASTESAADVPTPPLTNKRQKAPPQLAEAAETTAAVAASGAAEVVVGVARLSPPRPVVAGDDEVHAPDEPVVVWTSLGPLPRWVPGPTTQWAPGTTRLVPHDT
jgi:hypothetical protein